ncbi:BMC domain-containing protein [Lacrimispora sp. JR3]|uniref:BMC domain-containing protein n=1 Tax=Lacrimispora sinapis TaxID=3111456 RepID=UPI0037494806
MKQALGLVEIQGLSTAVLVADTMVKAANVSILEIENSKGQGYMTIKVAGDVGAVNAAVSAGRQTGLENQKLVSWNVIARPADSVEQVFGAAKQAKTEQEAAAEAEEIVQEEETIKKEDTLNPEETIQAEEVKETEQAAPAQIAEEVRETKEPAPASASAKRTGSRKNRS